MRSAVLPLCALVAGCTGTGTASGDYLTVRGRVVDAETCASTAGCTGVAGVVVSLAGAADRVRSAPTGSDGAFVLDGVPAGFRHDLLVGVGETGALRVAPTLNPMVLGPDDVEDVYGVELYVLPRDPDSLLEAARREGIDLALGGGYVGQVVRVDGTTVTAAEGARVVVYPPARSVRYVNVLPRFVPSEPALLAADAMATGAFGMFVVEADEPMDPTAVVPFQDGWEYDLVVAPISPGIVTYAVHRGAPAP